MKKKYKVGQKLLGRGELLPLPKGMSIGDHFVNDFNQKLKNKVVVIKVVFDNGDIGVEGLFYRICSYHIDLAFTDPLNKKIQKILKI